MGIQTQLYCALDEKVANESGHFYSNNTKFVDDWSAVSNYLANKGRDDEFAKRLWDLSCEWVKLEEKYKLPPANDDTSNKSQTKCHKTGKSRVNPVESN